MKQIIKSLKQLLIFFNKYSKMDYLNVGEDLKMVVSKNEELKMLLELSNSILEADNLICEYYPEYETYKLKIAFLQGMFDFEILGRNNINLKDDYYSILNAIINQKWR